MIRSIKDVCCGSNVIYFIFIFGKVTKWCVYLRIAQSCPTLCGPMDYSPPGSSVHGILQASILEWVAISFSRDGHPNCLQTVHGG